MFTAFPPPRIHSPPRVNPKPKTRNSVPENQLCFFAPTIIARVPGTSSITVTSGPPVAWLRPVQFAREFGVTRDTVYRWHDEGEIPEALVRYQGLRKLEIAAEAVAYCRENFAQRRAGFPAISLEKFRALKKN